MDATYVLPIRCREHPVADAHRELVAYLAGLADAGVEVIVVDNSEAAAFDVHAAAFAAVARHLGPDLATRNGKVGNVLTGVRAATNERVILADDDVRYDAGQIEDVARRLDGADVVVPVNVFDATPWHARWDTARTLLNRSFWFDFPGTLGVRRATLLAIGGYDGDVLFENLELMRTVDAAGGRVLVAPDVYVRRHPPSTRTFLDQRVRQAYDDLAQPTKLVAMLAIAPSLVWAFATRRRTHLAGAVVASIAMAEIGRRRSGGARVFPSTAPLWAPLWLAERGVCIWIAVARRVLLGGVRYRGERLRRAATPMRELRRRVGAQRPAVDDDEARERAAA
jgi:hypothetical protein